MHAHRVFLVFSVAPYVNKSQRTIAADPSLATLRHINKSALPMDGWTPLHAAAAKGNLEFIQVRACFEHRRCFYFAAVICHHRAGLSVRSTR